jgi:hypothetical protein
MRQCLDCNEASTSTTNDELLDAMRAAARQGASVKQLVRLVRTQGGHSDESVLPLMNAFHLPLVTVLPLRDWLANPTTVDIEALLLPEIVANQAKWSQ